MIMSDSHSRIKSTFFSLFFSLSLLLSFLSLSRDVVACRDGRDRERERERGDKTSWEQRDFSRHVSIPVRLSSGSVD